MRVDNFPRSTIYVDFPLSEEEKEPIEQDSAALNDDIYMLSGTKVRIFCFFIFSLYQFFYDLEIKIDDLSSFCMVLKMGSILEPRK